jgi:hypothetical protein
MKGKTPPVVELLEKLLGIDLRSPEVRDTVARWDRAVRSPEAQDMVSRLDRALRSYPNLFKWSAKAAEEYERQLARRLATALPARIDSMQWARDIASFLPNVGVDFTCIAKAPRRTEPAGPAKAQKRKRRESVAVNPALKKIADLGDAYPGRLTRAQWAKKFGCSVRTIARANNIVMTDRRAGEAG